MLSKIKNNTYIFQIITLMSGTLIAQLVTLAFIPIITRLYTPEEFGLYSLFISITSIIGLVSSLKYDQAIMLPKSDDDAQALLFLSVMITLLITCISLIILFLFYDLILSYFSGKSIIVFMIPFGILLVGLLQIFSAYSSRKQYYKKLSIVKVYNSTIMSSTQTISKYIYHLDGLVIGKLLGDFISFYLLLRYHLKKQTLQLKKISSTQIILNAKEHKNFPKYQSITVFLNAVSQSLPVLLFSYIFSPEIAGYYALTVRILQVPVGLIGGSTREVYYQKASKMYASDENIFYIYKKTTIGLLKLFILPLFIILFFGEYIFLFVFGEQWLASGQLAQILIVWILFLFINSPSISTFSILGIQKLQMLLEIILLPLKFLSIYAGFYFFNSYIMSIVFYTAINVLANLLAISIIYFKLKYKVK